MASRAAFSRIAPALAHARRAPSLVARRAALARGYATQSEHSVCTENRRHSALLSDVAFFSI